MGYVGIPLAVSFAREGFNVIGYDVNPEKVKSLNDGIYPIQGFEPGMPELVAQTVEDNKFKASTNPGVIAGCDAVFVVVDTPLVGEGQGRRPNVTNLEKACETIGKFLKKGTLVVVESTLAPGTMEKVVQTAVEKASGMKAGIDFALAHSPERVMPGKLLHHLETVRKIIGGINAESAKIAQALYENIASDTAIVSNLATAEAIKAGENTLRDHSIAFANFMAVLCKLCKANVYEVRDEINRYLPKNLTDKMLWPGAGVGGHCIPKDGVVLISNFVEELQSAGMDFTQLIWLAREINDFMPKHMNQLLEEALMELAGNDPGMGHYEFHIAVLGYSYLANSDDDRNSPTQAFLELDSFNATQITVHDPYVPIKNMEEGLKKARKVKQHRLSIDKNLQETISQVDAIVLFTAHDEYRRLDLAQLKKSMNANMPIIIDGRNVFNKEQARALGFIYKGIGNTC